jgi:hypothetical protein
MLPVGFLFVFSRFSVFVVFWGSWWLWGESVEFSGEYAGLMVVGEFLVFGKALLALRVRGS